MSNETKPEEPQGELQQVPQQEPPQQKPGTENPASLNTVLYDRYAEKSREIFSAGKEKGQEAWEKATELARQQMTVAGEFSAEQGEVFKGYLRRDLKQTIADMQMVGDEAKKSLHPARLGAGALSSLAKLLGAAGEALSALSVKAEHALEYQTGEITMAGTLTCQACGEKIQLHQTSVVPACPKCEGTRFRKSY
jgi:isocitrate dehydrogenase